MHPRTKRIDDAKLSRVAGALRDFVNAFHAGNTSAAARDLGISQPHLSAMVNGTRGVGLNVLLILRARTRRTLDDLLGLPPFESTPTRERAEADDRIREMMLKAVREELDRRERATKGADEHGNAATDVDGGPPAAVGDGVRRKSRGDRAGR